MYGAWGKLLMIQLLRFEISVDKSYGSNQPNGKKL